VAFPARRNIATSTLAPVTSSPARRTGHEIAARLQHPLEARCRLRVMANSAANEVGKLVVDVSSEHSRPQPVRVFDAAARPQHGNRVLIPR